MVELSIEDPHDLKSITFTPVPAQKLKNMHYCFQPQHS